MNAGWDEIAREIVSGSLMTALSLLKIIVPLMVIIEILLAYDLARRLALRLGWLARLLGLTKDALLPLLVGVLMGVTYGAGTLIEINRRTPLSKKDFALIAIFFYCCHGIIETSLLFSMAGANLLFISLFRLLIAAAVTMAAARLPWIRRL
ncbi:MAG: hypothetical protein LBS32_03020 [Clostridiales Family XIII bacterium]|nr:hypothetical protein [Clostridiales Family XIII bacterium]